MKRTEKLRLIAIEGILKSQNTALARALARVSRGELVLEADSSTPFVDFTSRDPQDLNFKKHLLRLIDRFKAQKQMNQTDMFGDSYVCDYLFFADRIYANCRLRADEKTLYDVMMAHMEKEVAIPDLVIYLQTTPDQILESLTAQYGKKQSFDEDYIKTLNNEFNEFFLYYRWSSVLIINASQLDQKKSSHVNELYQKMQRPFAGVIFYNPPIER